MRTWLQIIFAAAMLSIAVPASADAKAGSTGTTSYRSPSGSSYSKPPASAPSVNRSYSKPPDAPAAPAARDTPAPRTDSVNRNYSKPPSTVDDTPRGGGSIYSKPGGGSITTGAPVTRNALSDSVQKSASKRTLDQYDEEHRAFTQPPKAPVAPQQAAQDPLWTRNTQRWQNDDDYYTQRRRALAAEPPPPIYVQRAAPSYGMFAGGFLGGMLLDRILQPSYSNWAYSHQSDPAFQEWHRDMEQQAEDNAELKAKLATMDAKLAEMKAQNAKPNEDKATLPEGVDPAVAIAPDAALSALSQRKAPGSSHWIIWSMLALACFAVFAYFAFFRGKTGKRIVYER